MENSKKRHKLNYSPFPNISSGPMEKHIKATAFWGNVDFN